MAGRGGPSLARCGWSARSRAGRPARWTGGGAAATATYAPLRDGASIALESPADRAGGRGRDAMRRAANDNEVEADHDVADMVRGGGRGGGPGPAGGGGGPDPGRPPAPRG